MYDVDLAGDLTVSAAKDIIIVDNQQMALEVKDAGGASIVRYDTRDTGSAGVYTLSAATFNLKSSHTSFNNSDMSFQLVNDTTLRIVVKGSDSTVRHVDLTLS